MLSRRGILGAFLAAPAIIRTPGLLMAVKPLPPVIPAPLPLARNGLWTANDLRNELSAILRTAIQPLNGDYYFVMRADA